MLLELSREFVYLSKFEEPNLSWQNCILSVRSLKNLICFEFARDFNSFEKKINFVETNITCTNNSPIPSKYLRKYVTKGIKNIELTEMFMDPALWPHNDSVMQEMNKIASFQWSPLNVVFNNLNLLAIVNSVGNIDFYYSKGDHAMNFSEKVKDYLKSPKTSNVFKDLSEVKDVTYSLATSAICWSPELNQDNSCFFATAQKSGTILFWKIKCFNSEIQVDNCGSLQSATAEFKSILWIKHSDLSNGNKMFLICTNTFGQVMAYECVINDNIIKLIKEIVIWEHEDQMVARYLHYINCEDKIILIYSKHRHILVQLFNKDLKLLSQYVQNVNDYKITCITKCNDDVYVGTCNTRIYKVNYSISNDAIYVNLELIKLKETYVTHELYGFGISENNAIFAMALVDRSVRCRKGEMKFDIVFLKLENSFEHEIHKIINNPSRQLTHMWDLLEVVRYKMNKTKKMPNFDYDKLLLEGNSDIYKMKVYLAFLTFHSNLKLTKTDNETVIFSELSIEKVKEKILVLHAAQILSSIYEESKINKLNDFKLECLNGTRKFIDYYCKKYNKTVHKYILEDIYNMPQSNVDYVCQSCDDKIAGFSCESAHLNMFCSLSFTPIETNNYLVCKSCKLIARSELFEFKPKCVFCDSYLNFYDTIR